MAGDTFPKPKSCKTLFLTTKAFSEVQKIVLFKFLEKFKTYLVLKNAMTKGRSFLVLFSCHSFFFTRTKTYFALQVIFLREMCILRE